MKLLKTTIDACCQCPLRNGMYCTETNIVINDAAFEYFPEWCPLADAEEQDE